MMTEKSKSTSSFKEKASAFFKSVYQWFRTFLFALYKLPFILIIIILGFYALYLNDQGQDLMASFTQVHFFDSSYLRWFILLLFLWAASIWAVSRFLLSSANLTKLIESRVPSQIDDAKIVLPENCIPVYIDPDYVPKIRWLHRRLPRWLAMSPYLIFIFAYQEQNKFLDKPNDQVIYIVLLIAALHILFFKFRRVIAGPRELPGKKEEFSLEEEPHVFRAMKKARTLTLSIFTFIVVFGLFFRITHDASGTPSVDGKPGLVVIYGFTVYTIASAFFNYLLNKLRIPVFFLLLLFAVFIASNFNNNHTIQTLASQMDKDILETRNDFHDTAYFNYWLNKKREKGILNPSAKNIDTIYLVAAEGGGIRNCYWTFRVLSLLQDLNPKFYDRTFAVTGVSGGSIGLGFYYNYKYFFDSIGILGNGRQRYDEKLDSVCSSDYLSAVTYAFMFPDFIQRFIPTRIDGWDRSKYLANSFDDAFSHQLSPGSKKLLSDNYLKMWNDTSTAYKYPVILFNTIFNEDGTKAIFSPYRLSDKYYAGSMDLLYESNRCVPMKEAMVSSARFPVLTAPGLVWRDSTIRNKLDSAKLGHISDGGGFENTGIQTIEQTALLVMDGLRSKKLDSFVHVQIIYVGTGADSIEVENNIPAKKRKHSDPLNRTYELAWLNGGTNTIFGWIKSSHNLTVRLNPKLTVLQFGLTVQEKKDSHKLPLGWYLSPQSKELLKKQSTDSSAGTNFKYNLDAFQHKNRKKGAG